MFVNNGNFIQSEKGLPHQLHTAFNASPENGKNDEKISLLIIILFKLAMGFSDSAVFLHNYPRLSRHHTTTDSLILRQRLTTTQQLSKTRDLRNTKKASFSC
jgi:hypothetical protein